MTRDEYLATSLSRLRPTAGVSRSTWYRRARAQRVRSLLLRFSPAQRRKLRRLLDDLGAGDAAG